MKSLNRVRVRMRGRYLLITLMFEPVTTGYAAFSETMAKSVIPNEMLEWYVSPHKGRRFPAFALPRFVVVTLPIHHPPWTFYCQ